MSGRARTTFVIAIVALAGLSVLAASSASALTVPSRAAVQRALDQTVAAGVPGMTAVIRGLHGTERYSAGSANLRHDVPISPRDSARVGSVNKAFTATLILKLVGSGQLRLDDTVEELLPGVVPNGAAITVRELLNMSSGLADYCGIPYGDVSDLCTPPPSQMSRRWTPRQLVDIGVGAPPTFAPGQGWAYSNTNYVLLGMIVKRVTGQSLRAEYRQRIFRPLGLDHTRYAPRKLAMPKPSSHGYDVVAAGSLPADVTRTSPTIAGSAGAMISTVHDLQKFMRALVGGSLVPARLAYEMRVATPGSLHGAPPSQPLEGGGVATYGLGLMHFTWSHACGTFGHSGDYPGFHTLALSSANGKRGAAMYVNADALEAPGVIANLKAQRLVACRMRFGHIGSR